MPRTLPVLYMLGLGCASEAPAPAPQSVPQELDRSPDVLMVVLDTLRPDYLHSYGAPLQISPNLDAFAETSVLFEDVTAPGSWTWSVHASLFTGEPPWVHGAHRMESGELNLGALRVQGLRTDLPTLAEQLQVQGYATRSVSGNGLLRSELGLTRGFEQVVVHDDLDDQVLAQAQDWMTETAEQPLFLFVNLLGSHLPYVRYDAPWMEHEDRAALSEGWAAPWVDLHSTGNEALRLNRKATGEEHSLILSVASGERTLTEPQMEQLRDTYRSEIWATDQRLGRLLDSWAVHTGGEGIVLITSDHGEHFGELGLLDHGHVLNGINTRVPLMIQAPGAPPRRVVEPVSHLEVADTLRTLVGINAGSEGLVPRMQGEESDRVPILARTWPDPLWARTLGGDFDSGQRLVRFGDWALVALDNGKRSLYRVSADPLMLHDLSESHGKVVEELARLLGQMDSKDQATAPMPPSEDMLRALEELGYLEP